MREVTSSVVTIAAKLTFHNQCFFSPTASAVHAQEQLRQEELRPPFPCLCTIYKGLIQVAIASVRLLLPHLWLHTGSLPLYTPPLIHSFPHANSPTSIPNYLNVVRLLLL